MDTIRELLVQPIPHNPPSRVGVTVWHAFLARSVSDVQIQRIVLEAVDGACGELARLIGRAQQEGSLRTSLNPEHTARSLFALSYGLAQQALIGALDPERAVASADAMLAALA